jgi:hypothetical protein
MQTKSILRSPPHPQHNPENTNPEPYRKGKAKDESRCYHMPRQRFLWGFCLVLFFCRHSAGFPSKALDAAHCEIDPDLSKQMKAC